MSDGKNVTRSPVEFFDGIPLDRVGVSGVAVTLKGDQTRVPGVCLLVKPAGEGQPEIIYLMRPEAAAYLLEVLPQAIRDARELTQIENASN